MKLRHLLAHNSGLPGYVEFFRTALHAGGALPGLPGTAAGYAPGGTAEYSDPGFILLGKALEVITGEPLAQFVNREIFDPLGMSSTCFQPRLSARHAIPPTEEDNNLRLRIIQGEVQDENAYILQGAAGHAGLFSNVLGPASLLPPRFWPRRAIRRPLSLARLFDARHHRACSR